VENVQKNFGTEDGGEKIDDRFYCSKYENFGLKSDLGIKICKF
jgi:hypothetical protein